MRGRGGQRCLSGQTFAIGLAARRLFIQQVFNESTMLPVKG